LGVCCSGDMTMQVQQPDVRSKIKARKAQLRARNTFKSAFDVAKNKAPDLENYIGLAYKIAEPFRKRQQRIEDTEQFSDAMFGLCEAAMTYDPAIGVAFTTWATDVISNRVRKEYRWRGRKKRQLLVVEPEILANHPVEKPEFPCPTDLLEKLLADFDDSEKSKKGKQVLIRHYIQGETWADIGRDLGMSRAGAKFLGDSAIKHIRQQHPDLIIQFSS
jgi:RNA polymerase sigma factor (sigma-70 family)